MCCIARSYCERYYLKNLVVVHYIKMPSFVRIVSITDLYHCKYILETKFVYFRRAVEFGAKLQLMQYRRKIFLTIIILCKAQSSYADTVLYIYRNKNTALIVGGTGDLERYLCNF